MKPSIVASFSSLWYSRRFLYVKDFFVGFQAMVISYWLSRFSALLEQFVEISWPILLSQLIRNHNSYGLCMLCGIC